MGVQLFGRPTPFLADDAFPQRLSPTASEPPARVVGPAGRWEHVSSHKALHLLQHLQALLDSRDLGLHTHPRLEPHAEVVRAELSLQVRRRRREYFGEERFGAAGQDHAIVALAQHTSVFVGGSPLAQFQASLLATSVICVDAAESTRWKVSFSLKASRIKAASTFSGSVCPQPRPCQGSASPSWREVPRACSSRQRPWPCPCM